jgi:hypothetical protein
MTFPKYFSVAYLLRITVDLEKKYDAGSSDDWYIHVFKEGKDKPGCKTNKLESK